MQIGDLVNKSSEAQDKRWTAKINEIQCDLSHSRRHLSAADEEFAHATDAWSNKANAYVEKIVESRDSLKTKMKEDWKSINERNTTIQKTTKSVHEETIKIVDAQMADMAKQMQSLDDFVKRARSQNEQHHTAHLVAHQGIANGVQQTHALLESHFAAARERLNTAGGDVSENSTALKATLPPLASSIRQPLSELRLEISGANLEAYVPSGLTPQRKVYAYPTILPRTQSHNKILGRKEEVAKSPSKSPTKTLVYTDAQESEIAVAPPSPSKEAGLREISLNVGAALQRNNSDPSGFGLSRSGKAAAELFDMGPPALKRQATESKLPTKLGMGKGGVVRLEGRENLSASLGSSTRRLRSSPKE